VAVLSGLSIRCLSCKKNDLSCKKNDQGLDVESARRRAGVTPAPPTEKSSRKQLALGTDVVQAQRKIQSLILIFDLGRISEFGVYPHLGL
jgi:hypothetical protein